MKSKVQIISEHTLVALLGRKGLAGVTRQIADFGKHTREEAEIGRSYDADTRYRLHATLGSSVYMWQLFAATLLGRSGGAP